METKDSEYYMGNREELPVILTLKNGNSVITFELPWDANADEILNAVYSGMVGLTFNPDDVLQAMQDFVNDHKRIAESRYEETRPTHKFNIGDKVEIINGPFSENTIDGKILDIVYVAKHKVLYKVSFMLLEKNVENEYTHATLIVTVIDENDLKLDI